MQTIFALSLTIHAIFWQNCNILGHYALDITMICNLLQTIRASYPKNLAPEYLAVRAPRRRR